MGWKVEAPPQRKSLSDWQTVRKPWLIGFPTAPVEAYAYQRGVSLVPASLAIDIYIWLACRLHALSTICFTALPHLTRRQRLR